MRAAWKDYLQRVQPTSARQVRNFMLACLAEGRNPDRDDTERDAAANMPAIRCKLTAADVSSILEISSAAPAPQSKGGERDDEICRVVNRKLSEAVRAAARVIDAETPERARRTSAHVESD